MTAPGYPRRKVVRVTRSPTAGRHQWHLDLSCGHGVYVSSKARPRRTTQPCPYCHLWRPAPVDAFP